VIKRDCAELRRHYLFAGLGDAQWDEIESPSLHGSESRVAAHLLAHVPQPEADSLRLSARKGEIAAQLGLAPEILSRMLRSLSQRGLIKVRGALIHPYMRPCAPARQCANLRRRTSRRRVCGFRGASRLGSSRASRKHQANPDLTTVNSPRCRVGHTGSRTRSGGRVA